MTRASAFRTLPGGAYGTILVLMAGSGAVLGCAASGVKRDPSTSINVTSATQESEYPVGAEWRLTQLWASPESLNKAAYALWQEGITACMNSVGFVYKPITYVSTESDYRLINPLNEAVAEARGYHDAPSVVPEDPNTDVRPEYANALFDNPRCADRASAFAYGVPAVSNFSAAQTIAIRHVDERVITFDSTSGAAQLMTAWAQCMRSHGYDYSTPTAAKTQFSRSEDVGKEEREVRLADLACDKQVGLTQGRSEYQQAELRAWASSHAQQLAELQRLLDIALREIGARQEQLAQDGAVVLPTVPGLGVTTESIPPASGTP